MHNALQAKEERTIQIVTSTTMNKTVTEVQKPESVIIWEYVSVHGMGNLHSCDCTINAKRYIYAFVFQGSPFLFQQNNTKPHSAQCIAVKEWVRYWALKICGTF